uniref:Ubiquitin-like protease family profile domain-containing protein n=1 Tax=Oryza brachyantha TaxID=4533 RepID=J3KUJ9_ORYBR
MADLIKDGRASALDHFHEEHSRRFTASLQDLSHVLSNLFPSKRRTSPVNFPRDQVDSKAENLVFDKRRKSIDNERNTLGSSSSKPRWDCTPDDNNLLSEPDAKLDVIGLIQKLRVKENHPNPIPDLHVSASSQTRRTRTPVYGKSPSPVGALSTPFCPQGQSPPNGKLQGTHKTNKSILVDKTMTPTIVSNKEVIDLVSPDASALSSESYDRKCIDVCIAVENLYNKNRCDGQNFNFVRNIPIAQLGPNDLTPNQPLQPLNLNEASNGQQIHHTSIYSGNRNFFVSRTEKSHYDAVIAMSKGQYSSLKAIRLNHEGFPYVTYSCLGYSFKAEGKVDNFVINCFCRLLFLDNHPSNSKKHYFFNTVGSHFMKSEKDFKSADVKYEFQQAHKVRSLQSCEMIHFPILCEDHWFLFTVDLKDRNFVFIDSLHTEQHSFHTAIKTKISKTQGVTYIKSNIALGIIGGIADREDAKTYMANIEEKFKSSSKAYAMAHAGWYPLVLALVIKSVKLKLVLIVGGSALNIVFVKTLDDMKIPRFELCPRKAPFHRVFPGLSATPLKQITLSVTFGTKDNYRTKTISFEVTDFETAYHAIISRPKLAKLKGIPNYTYLMVRMPEPH